MSVEKKQHMTCLRGTEMVSKSDPWIAFRGKIDTAMAEAAYGAALAEAEGKLLLRDGLNDIVRCLMEVMGAEVCLREPVMPTVAGRDLETLHDMSHDPIKYFGSWHFVPEPHEGAALSWTNVLRTRVREAERDLIVACENDINEGLCYALNRISSAVFVLMCEEHVRCKG